MGQFRSRYSEGSALPAARGDLWGESGISCVVTRSASSLSASSWSAAALLPNCSSCGSCFSRTGCHVNPTF